jgi:purine-nucleoside phosphorylase
VTSSTSVTSPDRPADDLAALPARLDHLEALVRRRSPLRPRVGIVLGSGLGGLAARLQDPVAIDFPDLPGWPAPGAPGHAGRLLLGWLEGVPVALLQGRLHLYEGHPPLLVAEPVLLIGRLGAARIVLTNAAGGVNPSFSAGTLMVIADHLNLTGRSPLVGRNADAMGPRFPDLTAAWSPQLRRRLHEAAAAEGLVLAEGVYAGLLGPAYETPAEVRMLRTLGADAVGMSTVMEAIAARWAGLELAGISLITNPAAGLSSVPLSHHDVLAAAAEAGPRLERILVRFVRELETGGEGGIAEAGPGRVSG